MSLPVFESHLVKQNVVGEWAPLESGSETMTVSVLVTMQETTVHKYKYHDIACLSVH